MVRLGCPSGMNGITLNSFRPWSVSLGINRICVSICKWDIPHYVNRTLIAYWHSLLEHDYQLLACGVSWTEILELQDDGESLQE
jgi:hypothetical protein